MAEKTYNFKLGLFVICSVALLVIAMMLLGAGALFRKTYTFETYMTESVQGLEAGAPVKIRGVQIGQVSEITFAEAEYPVTRLREDPEAQGPLKGLILVEFKVGQAFFQTRHIDQQQIGTMIQSQVAEGMRIRMTSSGITGPPFLSIDMMDPTKFPPLEVPWTPKNYYIPSAPSTLSRIVTSAETILDAIENANITSIIDTTKNLLENLDRSVEEARVGKLSEEASDLLIQLGETNKKLQKMLESKAISKAVENIPEAVAEARGLIRQMNSIVASERDDLDAIMNNLRKITENLEALSAEARDNPSQVIFGDPPPREDQ